MGMKLYTKHTSAPCRSVYMVLELLNISDVEYVIMNLKGRDHFKEDFLKLNPQHTIPTLVDGDFAIWDSHAIVTYLVNQYGKEDGTLYPKDPKKRAIVDQRLHFVNAILYASLRETLVPLLYEGEKSYRPEFLAKINSGYEFLDKFCTDTWLAGDSVTLADVCCVANISSLNEVLPIDKDAYPNLAAWFDRCSKQDFYIKANVPGLKDFQELLKSVLE